MKTVWTQGLEKDIAKEVQMSFNGSAVLRQRLELILTNKISSRHKKGCSEQEYENPNWAYKKADEAGYARALAEIVSILK